MGLETLFGWVFVAMVSLSCYEGVSVGLNPRNLLAGGSFLNVCGVLWHCIYKRSQICECHFWVYSWSLCRFASIRKPLCKPLRKHSISCPTVQDACFPCQLTNSLCLRRCSHPGIRRPERSHWTENIKMWTSIVPS